MAKRFAVYLEPYSLAQGEVGSDIYKPILISRHNSPKEAAKRIVRLITGKDSTARDYLRQVNNNPVPIALRYLAHEIAESGRLIRKLSVKQLRESE